ncbi:MAG: hypothetical protein ABIQ97_00740 [Lysobacteraceae bacterium]
MKTVAYTSAAINYLPKVRKLCASIKRFHPEFEVVLALADRIPPGIDFADEPIDAVIAVEDIAIPDRERWIYFHSIVELATAIKPFVLKTLLAREDVSRVIYFDPDMVLFSRLDDLLSDLEGNAIALTPHQVKPETTLDAVRDNEIASLKHGVYNLGFLAVNDVPAGRRFADWWAERVYHFCIADIPNGLFTDQRWVDLAPAFFDGVKILKNPRFNVATWNLTTRLLAGSVATGFTVDGEPLGFYHFTGFDSGAHGVMANKNAAGNAAVAELVQWYTDQTRFDTHETAAKVRWAFNDYSDGVPVPLAERRLYRARPDLQQVFPNPFMSNPDHSLQHWMRTQGPLEHPELLEKKA